MLLTRKSSPSTQTAAAGSRLVSTLARSVQRTVPTMDRRAFLRRSGMGVGAGIAASQLTPERRRKARRSIVGTVRCTLRARDRKSVV